MRCAVREELVVPRFVNPTPTPTPKPDQVLSVREQLALCPSPRRCPTTAGSMAGSMASSPVVGGGGKMGGGKAAAAVPAAPAAPALARHSSSELEEMAAFEPLTSNPSPKLLSPNSYPNSHPQLLPPTPTPNS